MLQSSFFVRTTVPNSSAMFSLIGVNPTGFLIDYIEPGKPNQNAFIERFNRSYRAEVLDTWLFRNLDEVRELGWAWTLEYNEERDHDRLGGLTPAEVLYNARISTFELST